MTRLRIARSTPRRPRGAFSTIEDAVAAMREGRLIVVVDDEDRENEGDLTLAAEKVTPEAINFMITHGRGLVCLALTAARLDELEIPLVVADNSSRRGTPMCVSIDAKDVTTGVSAPERAQTITGRARSGDQAARSHAAGARDSAAGA